MSRNAISTPRSVSVAHLRAVERVNPDAPLNEGGGGGNSGDMDARVAKLEALAESADRRLNGIEDTLKSINSELKSLGKEMAEMKGQLKHMPTTWSTIGMFITVMGAAFGILKLAGVS